MRYSIASRDRIYAKGYRFLSFAKNIAKILSIKYGQKLLDITKKVATDALRTASKRAIQKMQVKFQRSRKLLQRVPSKLPGLADNKHQYNQLGYQKRITYQQKGLELR